MMTPVDLFDILLTTFGPQHWWPGGTPFEVAIGAVLTQNTSWSNVEQAIDALRSNGALSTQALTALPEMELATLIRPAGYHNMKARTLRALSAWLMWHTPHGDPAELTDVDLQGLRADLLSVHGIGKETADSILLYAAGRPIFVADAYTRRIGARLGLLPDNTTYDTAQQYFIARLPEDVHLFNEFHALLVRLAKEHCRARPVCLACPLEQHCPSASASSATRHAVSVRTMPERRSTP
jgi:endonuclease III related protein